MSRTMQLHLASLITIFFAFGAASLCPAGLREVAGYVEVRATCTAGNTIEVHYSLKKHYPYVDTVQLEYSCKLSDGTWSDADPIVSGSIASEVTATVDLPEGSNRCRFIACFEDGYSYLYAVPIEDITCSIEVQSSESPTEGSGMTSDGVLYSEQGSDFANNGSESNEGMPKQKRDVSYKLADDNQDQYQRGNPLMVSCIIGVAMVIGVMAAVIVLIIKRQSHGNNMIYNE